MSNRGVVIVTGASHGIGRASATTLAKAGYKVVVNYLQAENESSGVIHEIKALGGEAIGIRADVSNLEHVQQLVEKTISSFGSVDYLVNNAGAILMPGAWNEIGDETWKRTLDIDLKGMLNCTRAVAPLMLKKQRGKIVNMSSTFGIMGNTAVIAYAVAKAGVINLTHSFAKELAPFVNVNAIAPGIIDTRMTRAAPAEFVKKQMHDTPLQRLGKPEDIANAVEFLISEKSDFITGHVLVVDGGHILRDTKPQ